MASNFQNFGKYILLEKLATGGMAEVHLAKITGATGIAKFVALKRILPQYSDNPEFIEMFKEEAKIAVNLNHSNVVSIFDFGVEQKQFYLVMEFVEGRNLRQILNHMKKSSINFSIDQVAYVIKEVAAGLDHAHRCLDGTTGRPLNITHRDISPQNVMVSFEGEVKVVDFGIAKAESQIEHTRAGTIKGKFSYMSPEQAEGMAVDLRTDVFSLGIVLWELLANDRLFIGSNEMAILKKIRSCQVPDLDKLNPNVPPELVRICKKALARDRNLRYQTASALHKDLNRFLNTHYPDFSAQDFSIFMKTLYSDTVLQNRRKFVEYSQVTSAQAKEPENTEVSFNTLNDNPVESSINLNSTSSKPIKLDGLDTKTIFHTREGTFEKSLSYNELSFPHTKGSVTRRRKAPPPKRSSMLANVFLIAGFMLLMWGVWDQLVQRNLIPGSLNQLVGQLSAPGSEQPAPESPPQVEPSPQVDGEFDHTKTAAPTPPKKPKASSKSEDGQIEMAQTGVHVVHVQSVPSSAEIWVDGKNTGLITPGRIRVRANTPFTLGLKRKGFLDYEHRFITRHDTTFKATLQQSLNGFLNLTVTNGGANPKVYINGQELAEKLPIKRYSVPAKVPLHIRVENPYTRLSAEETITLETAERKDLHLILK